ncbi:unnamed protein product [Chrysoparadoxa australica]
MHLLHPCLVALLEMEGTDFLHPVKLITPAAKMIPEVLAPLLLLPADKAVQDAELSQWYGCCALPRQEILPSIEVNCPMVHPPVLLPEAYMAPAGLAAPLEPQELEDDINLRPSLFCCPNEVNIEACASPSLNGLAEIIKAACLPVVNVPLQPALLRIDGMARYTAPPPQATALAPKGLDLELPTMVKMVIESSEQSPSPCNPCALLAASLLRPCIPSCQAPAAPPELASLPENVNRLLLLLKECVRPSVSTSEPLVLIASAPAVRLSATVPGRAGVRGVRAERGRKKGWGGQQGGGKQASETEVRGRLGLKEGGLRKKPAHVKRKAVCASSLRMEGDVMWRDDGHGMGMSGLGVRPSCGYARKFG